MGVGGWHGRLILAAGSMLDHPAPLVIEAAAAAGFDGIGLRWSGEHATVPAPQVRRRVADAGLELFDAEVIRIVDATTDHRPFLDDVAAAGAAAVLVVADTGNRAVVLEALQALVAQCRSRRLRVGLEYMAFTHPPDPWEALAVAREVGCELVVDALHHARLGAGPDELTAIVEAGHLGWFQLCDAPAGPPAGDRAGLVHEARHSRLVPGSGGLPLAALVGCLPADATVTVEVQSEVLSAMAPQERARVLHDASRWVLTG